MEEEENSEVAGPAAIGEREVEAPRSCRRWRFAAVAGAVVAVLLATAVSSRSFPKLWISNDSCGCPVGEIFFTRLSVIL